ncbi:MAG: GatB/YqeY domain-containing protein [Actinomycetota bacterium]
MGEVADALSTQIKEALKAGEKTRLSTLRMLSASVRNKEVELGHDLTEEEFVEVVGREVKRRKEAAEAYASAGRPELETREREEQAILEVYLPEQLSEEELAKIVDEAIEATGAAGPKEVGKVMAHVMGKFKGQADGSTVGRLARERLDSPE